MEQGDDITFAVKHYKALVDKQVTNVTEVVQQCIETSTTRKHLPLDHCGIYKNEPLLKESRIVIEREVYPLNCL